MCRLHLHHTARADTADRRDQQAGCRQTEVRVGHLGVRRGHETTWRSTSRREFSAAGANRLQVLRTERGLTYGASADFRYPQESGAFEASRIPDPMQPAKCCA